MVRIEQKVNMILEGQKIESILKGTPNTSGRKTVRLTQCFDYLVRIFIANTELITYKFKKVQNRNAAKNLEAKNRTRKLKPNFIQKYSSCIQKKLNFVFHY